MNAYPDGIPIVFERRFLGCGYRAGLIFPNEDVSLSLDRNTPYPTFRIVGHEDDIRLFWKTFYQRAQDRAILSGIATGGTINPARFLYQHLLYPRARFYRVFRDKCGPDPLPIINTRLFRGLLPPGILFSILTAAPTATIDLEPLEFEATGHERYSAAKPVTGTVPIEAANITLKSC